MKTIVLLLLCLSCYGQQAAKSIAELETRRGGRHLATITLLGKTNPNDGSVGNSNQFFYDSTYVGTGNHNTIVKGDNWAMGAWIKLTSEATTIMPSVTAVVASTAETTLFSKTVLGGEMGSNKSIRGELVCDVTASGLVNPTLTLTLKFGSASLIAVSAGGISLNVTNEPLIIAFTISNRFSATNQYAKIEIRQNDKIIPLSVSKLIQGGNWNVDTTQDQVLSATAKFSAASATTVLGVQTVNALIR